MPKGYWLAQFDVQDPDIYESYKSAAAGPLRAHGGRFLVRGGEATSTEGRARARSVVIEFPSYQAALDCYNSHGYQEARAIRETIAQGEFAIVEGYDGPQY